MWRATLSKFLFTQQSFKSSFQIRSKLSQFFKHTHPDTNVNAPETIKQQNLRSLKNLNSYIDSLLHSKPIEGKLLKFYVSEKSNMKSKKYYAFEVELPEVKLTNSEGGNNKILNNVIDVLNSKFLETRVLKNPLLKKQMNKEKQTTTKTKKQTQQQRMKRMENQLRPYKQRRRTVTQQFKDLMNQKIKTSFKNVGRQSLLGELQKKVLLANTPTNKPLMWSRIGLKNAGIYSNYQEVLASILDPNLIYLSEQLTGDQIQQFKKILLPGQQHLKPKESQTYSKMHKIFLQMQEAQPPIFLYVTNKYSYKQIPGFFSIPYNFKPQIFIKQFLKHKYQLLEQRQRYEQYYDAVQDICQQLSKQNNISIQFQQFKNNSDISRKLLMLKRLLRYKLNDLTLFVPFDSVDYKYFCKQYELQETITTHLVGGKIICNIQFSDVDLEKTIVEINS